MQNIHSLFYSLQSETKLNGLKKLPGVGSKSAERMAYQILEMKARLEEVGKLSEKRMGFDSSTE